MKTIKTAAVGISLLLAGTTAYAGETFDTVKDRGFVQCGVSTGIPGFSMPDSKGEWTGIDVDMCKAIAATMFGDASKFKVTPLNTQQWTVALQSGEVDVITRNSTASMTRNTSLGLLSTGVNFYDSQGVMVKKDLNLESAKDLDGATVCVQPATTTEQNLSEWFRANNLEFQPVVIESPAEATRSFVSGRCDAFTTDKSQLAAVRSTLENPQNYDILPDNLSKEPLSPYVRQGDDQWFNVVRWALNAMIVAEEFGVTSDNVDDMLQDGNPAVQRMLGASGALGEGTGVDNKWAYNIIKQVGNYGESFARNLGPDTPMQLPRGLNALQSDGGLMYGWPLR